MQRTDQLAELSRSFNRMTGSLQRLLVEQKEKERLQNEISIAQEVQANLFPHQMSGLATAGTAWRLPSGALGQRRLLRLPRLP